MSALPGPLRLPSAFPFVGRTLELDTLRALTPWATDEGQRVALVAGEAGSGKSRLVREFAADAAERGALVLYGACDAVVRAPYGAFVEALEELARVIDPAELQAALGPTGGELARLVPWAGEPEEADPDTVRHRLHTAVADLLEGVSRERPVVLVLEDVHWGDNPTIGMLRHLARAGGRARLLLLATFRDTDLPLFLTETLADLRRSEDVVRLKLSGLSGEEVGEFVRRAGGEGHVARTISELTAGNPFLVCELWRAHIDTGELATPESVREVVSGRLARLRPATCDLLELAAAAGPEFELEILRAAARVEASELPDALDEAVHSGIIEELPSVRLAYRFAHELVRRALYDALSGLRRAELHLRVGEALERAGGAPAADLAHHFTVAAPLAGAERGVDYNVRAARAAAAGLAFDEADERLGVALALGVADPAERSELLIELGTVRHRAGRALDALEAFAEAAAVAPAPELLARAAIGYENACWRPVITDEVAVGLLERAAAELDPEPSQLRVGVLGGLARALLIRGEHARGAAVRAEAEAMARVLGDRAALANVLVGSYWARGMLPTEQVLELLTEARDIAGEIGDIDLRSEAMNWRVPALLSLCDIDAASREIAVVYATAERSAQPFHLHVAEHNASAIALCEGRLEAAEAMALRAHEWSKLLTGRDASGVYGIQMFGIRREQGRLAELAPIVRLLARQGGHWRPGLASLFVELEMEADARRELAQVAESGLDQFRESLWLASLTYLTDACAAVGDAAVAALVYPELEALDCPNVVIGHVVACYGATDRYLGMLATVLGEWELAEAPLRARARAQPAHGRRDLARAHAARVRAHAGRLRARRGCAVLRGRRARRADRDAGAAAQARAARRDPLGRAARRSLPPRGPDPRARGRGPVEPRDRHGAVHLRAHRREPHPQHFAQDTLRKPDRSGLLRA